MPSLYCIVPLHGDGCHVLGVDKSLVHKGEPDSIKKRMWFTDEEAATYYIYEHLGPDQYGVEEFWSLFIPCPDCGTYLKAMHTDRNGSCLYNCPNDDCGLDWLIDHDAEDIFRIQRKYWG